MEKRQVPYIVLWSLALGVLVTGANATQIEPTEIVEATPLDQFSERTSFWPHQQTSADLLRLEDRPIFDSLNDQPGIQASSSGSPFVSIRGSGGSDRILGLYDGLSVNFHDGFGMNTLLIPRETLQEVDFLKGPSSVFYGSDAMGGALQFKTRYFKRPTVRAHALSTGASVTQTDSDLFMAAPLITQSEHSALQVTAFQSEQGGEFAYVIPHSGKSGLRTRNDSHLGRYTLAGYQQPLGNWLISEKLVYGHEIGSVPGSATFPSPNTFDNQGLLAAVTNSVRVHPRWNVAHRLSFMKLDKNFLAESTQVRTLSHTQKVGNSFSVTQDTRLAQIEYMVDHQYNQDESTRTIGTLKVQQELDAGATARIPLTEDWMIVPGVRSMTSVGDYVKSLGLIQDQREQRIWLTYGEGLKLPSFTQLYGDSQFYLSNPSLRPEHSSQTEIGFTKKADPLATDFKKTITYGFTAFATNYSDLQVAQSVGNVFQYQNQKNAYASGFDLDGGARFYNLILHAQYSYLRTQDQTGQKPLPRSPEDQASLVVQYPFGPAIFELKDTYWGRYYLSTGSSLVEMMPWHAVDFTVKTLALSDWSARAGVLNIFDASREFTLDFPEQQRRFFVAVERSL